jgi:hypothetical protein
MTTVSMGGFTLHATEAPLKDTSMIRQLCTSPFGKMSFEVLTRGMMRSCLRSSPSPRLFWLS